MKQEIRSSKKQGASARQRGLQEALISLMRRTGVPLTRKAYLDLEFHGHPPEHLTVEQELDMPTMFQRKA
jgi:hypothetical protein